MLFLKSFFIICSIALSPASWATSDSELLSPDEAFQATGTMPNAHHIAIVWKIAKGYSLYRKNMRFESKTPEVSLGEATFPSGKIKHDELLGDIEHFRDELNIDLPITLSKDISAVSLQIRYQGCADIGVCYPPQMKVLELKLPATHFIGSNNSPVDNLVTGFSNLKANLFQAELLPPDQAFKFFVTVKDPHTLHASWQIAKGYYPIPRENRPKADERQ